jgi:hypothetical protein
VLPLSEHDIRTEGTGTKHPEPPSAKRGRHLQLRAHKSTPRAFPAAPRRKIKPSLKTHPTTLHKRLPAAKP